MIIENFNDDNFKSVSNRKELEKILLNGAENWNQYSYGGCALIYDTDIAVTLCKVLWFLTRFKVLNRGAVI